jgi:hypothetical protein
MQLSKKEKQFVGQLMAKPKKPAAVSRLRNQNKQGSRGAQSRGNSAPVATGYTAPPVGMRSLAPSRQGAEIRVTGCDYYGSISADTAFEDVVLALSPLAANGTFPRLGAIASVFGKYAWNKIKLYVVAKAASTLAGDMTSVPVYDGTYGANALTEAQAKNRTGQVTSKFWENHVMDVDCKKATVPWFPLNQADTVSTTDTSNFGFIHFCTEAVSTATAVADLFIEYDIEFCEGKALDDDD